LAKRSMIPELSAVAELCRIIFIFYSSFSGS
jgi:hypothetical protein